MIPFLKKNAEKLLSGSTHVVMYPDYEKSAYYVEYELIDQLLQKYCDSLHKNDSLGLGIAEKITGAGPILVDIDLKRKDTDELETKNIYNRDDVLYTIKQFHETIQDLMGPDLTDDNYLCVLLEKPPYRTEDGYVKNGFHLHFPNLFVPIADQENHIISRLTDSINQRFSKYDVRNAYDGMAGVRNPWLMYRCQKNGYSNAYTVSTIFDRNLNEVGLKSLEKIDIYDSNSELIDTKNNIEYYLPRILSVIPYGRKIFQVPIKAMDSFYVSKITHSRNQTKNKNPSYELNPDEMDSNFRTAKILIDMLNPQRADDYRDWLNVGWILFNSCGNGRDVLELWLHFSSKSSEKFDEQSCIRAWGRMQQRNLTIGTLHWMASNDSPEKYAKFKAENDNKSLLVCIAGSHYDIAVLLRKDFGDCFRCTGVKGKKWYIFEDHVWNISEEGIDLRKKLSTDLVVRFEHLLQEYRKKLAELDQAERSINENNDDWMDESAGMDIRRAEKESFIKKTEIYKRNMEKINKMVFNLKSSGFKDKVMKECQEVFYDKNFDKRLDTNTDLIAFTNGVYNLVTHEFRPGHPSDCLSKKMPIGYSEFYEHDPRISEVNRFFEKIFPDISNREYFLDISCTIFKGGNSEKKVYFWTGYGNNGKSVTMKIFEKMFGRYYVSLPTSLISGKRTQASAADPSLARTGNGARLVVMQEPNIGDVLNIGIVKELSGNDSYFARDLYEAGKQLTEINPMFKMILVCNQPPAIPRGDVAIWNRIRIIPFESEFVDKSRLPKTKEEQLLEKKFLDDKQFTKRIPELLEPLAWMLLQRYKRTKGVIREEPDKVTRETQKYKVDNDFISQFVLENIDQTEDTEDKLSLGPFYKQFKNWFKENSVLDIKSVPSRKEFMERIEKDWGRMEKKKNFQGWVGFRFKTLDIDDEDEIIM